MSTSTISLKYNQFSFREKIPRAGGRHGSSCLVVVLNIVPKLSIHRSKKKNAIEPKKVLYFENSFDNSINDNGKLKR